MAEVGQVISDTPPKKGGILAALRHSPLVGAELEIDRLFTRDQESSIGESVPRSEPLGRDLGEPPTQG